MAATYKETVKDFLAQNRIAVTGVSRSDAMAPANAIWKKLRGAGYEVFPVNPNAEQIEGTKCFATVRAITPPVDAVMIASPPATAEEIVRACIELGIRRVWMHRSLGEGSVSAAAVKLAEENGIRVIAGACPMMFVPPVDFAHRCLRWVVQLTGNMPK